MITWLASLAIGGMLHLQPESLAAAPFDITIGQQQVDLRAPLIARAPGVRMVLFVRKGVPAEFERANPAGSITAHLSTTDGRAITLEHTGYYYYHGMAGLILTEADAASRGERFAHLELEAKVPLQRVHLVWLDRLARRVQDLETSL